MTPPLEIRRAWRAAIDLHERFYIRDAADIDVRGIAALLGVEGKSSPAPVWDGLAAA